MSDGVNILFESRKVLQVKEGTIGLRQSDAFFQHVQNIPVLYDALCDHIDINAVKNIVVSNRPRPLEDSYMPVFTAGLNFAKVIAKTLHAPLITISHQENHLYASIFEMQAPLDQFIGVHISGGTSEVLKVSNNTKLDIDLLGTTLDLSFGKLIDRMGVYMGLSFPCGKALDDLANQTQVIYPLKYAVNGGDFNISGIENKLKELFVLNNNKEAVAHTLFHYISEVLIRQLDFVLKSHKDCKIIMSGGVSANTIIRQVLKAYYGDLILFSSIKFATDHSIGNAYYGNLVMTY